MNFVITIALIYFIAEDIIVHGVDLMQEVSSAIETLLLVICTTDTTGVNLKSLMVTSCNAYYILIIILILNSF